MKLLNMIKMIKDRKNIKARYESFGGIVSSTIPPALVYVDKKIMKKLGYKESPLWEKPKNYLSAPTEVHFNITNYCPLNCKHCATDSEKSTSIDMSTKDIKRAIDILADMKVFHIAFGGGEIFSREDAIEIAEYTRSKGIVPNATTNGYYMTEELAKQCKIFGQINVSLDGIGKDYGVIRGENEFERADNAIRQLKKANVDIGINCVLTRMNFDKLEETIAYADKLNLNEVLLIRLKPSGRAKNLYDDFKLTQKQNTEFYPFVKKMLKKYKPKIQFDCSFVPNICYHNPPIRFMEKSGFESCVGGNVLLGVRHDGFINACSHYDKYIEDIYNLSELWNSDKHFQSFRERSVSEKKCRNCSYFSICKGGCPLFAEFITGDFNAPDPECPILMENK